MNLFTEDNLPGKTTLSLLGPQFRRENHEFSLRNCGMTKSVNTFLCLRKYLKNQ